MAAEAKRTQLRKKHKRDTINKKAGGFIKMSEAEKIIREVDSSMAMEGMPLTDDDKERIKLCLENPSRANDILQMLLRKHTVAVAR